jgi:hypothetical protein
MLSGFANIRTHKGNNSAHIDLMSLLDEFQYYKHGPKLLTSDLCSFQTPSLQSLQLGQIFGYVLRGNREI